MAGKANFGGKAARPFAKGGGRRPPGVGSKGQGAVRSAAKGGNRSAQGAARSSGKGAKGAARRDSKGRFT